MLYHYLDEGFFFLCAYAAHSFVCSAISLQIPEMGDKRHGETIVCGWAGYACE